MRKFLDNNQQVAHYFANNVQSEGKASNFYFENDRLYSYGKHFCIARRLPGGAVAFTTRTYGNSTSKHLNYARQALRGQTLVYCNDPDSSAYFNRRESERAMLAELDNAATTRRILPKTRDAHRAAALHIAEQFNAYLAALPENERENAQPFDTSGESMAGLREARAALVEQQKAQAEAQIRKRAEAQRDALAAWLAGGPNNGGMHALPVALRIGKSRGDHHTGGLLPDTGSEGREVIQTSHGAEIPVAHGVALWPIVKSVVSGERTAEDATRLVGRLGVYNLNYIDSAGSIRVGCHDIAYSELYRMAVLLKLETV